MYNIDDTTNRDGWIHTMINLLRILNVNRSLELCESENVKLILDFSDRQFFF